MPQKERKYPHYHPTKGYGYSDDMTPEIDWKMLTNTIPPEGRFFNDDELKEIFILSHRLTPENIELMKKYDRDNNLPDRFKRYQNCVSYDESLSIANTVGGTTDYKVSVVRFMNGDYSQIEFNFHAFKEFLLKEYYKKEESDEKDLFSDLL